MENREIILHEKTLKHIISDLENSITDDLTDTYSEYCRGLRDAYNSILRLLD